MSEFSSLTTKLITPLLKRRGLKKTGPFSRGATHDSALYRKDGVEVELTYSIHPYDYPEIGIRLVVRGKGRATLDRLYPPGPGGVAKVLRSIADDLSTMADL
jgi:hypothetical protein